MNNKITESIHDNEINQKTLNEKEVYEKINNIDQQLNNLELANSEVLNDIRNELSTIKNYQKIQYDEDIIEEDNSKKRDRRYLKKEIGRILDVSPKRLLSLTDGIFRMTMVLLILQLSIPMISFSSHLDFVLYVKSLIFDVGVGAISYIIVTGIWIAHIKFLKIKKLNAPYIWLNIFHIAFVTAVPFTLTIVSRYNSFLLSNLIYGLNIVFLIFSFYLLLKFGYKYDLIENDDEVKSNYIKRTLVDLSIFTIIITILESFVSYYCIYLYILIPVFTSIKEALYIVKYSQRYN